MKLRLYRIIFCLVVGMTAAIAQAESSPLITVSPISQTMQQQMTIDQALTRLKEGNSRFVTNQMIHRDLESELLASKGGQYPFAVVLNCMDSRAIPEVSLDQGIGDMFTIRVAGNISNTDVLGSMEYATAVMGAKVIVVMGHTACGAVKGACQSVKLGHLTSLIAKIKPAVTEAMQTSHLNDCNNAKLVDDIAKDNVLLVMKEIQAQSPIINKLVSEHKVAIIGAMYDLQTGKIAFFS